MKDVDFKMHGSTIKKMQRITWLLDQLLASGEGFGAVDFVCAGIHGTGKFVNIVDALSRYTLFIGEGPSGIMDYHTLLYPSQFSVFLWYYVTLF